MSKKCPKLREIVSVRHSPTRSKPCNARAFNCAVNCTLRGRITESLCAGSVWCSTVQSTFYCVYGPYSVAESLCVQWFSSCMDRRTPVSGTHTYCVCGPKQSYSDHIRPLIEKTNKVCTVWIKCKSNFIKLHLQNLNAGPTCLENLNQISEMLSPWFS